MRTAHASIGPGGLSLGGSLGGIPERRTYAEAGYTFRYADGRVERRRDVDPDRSTWRVLVQPDPNLRPGTLTFRRVALAEQGRPDVIEYHEDDPSAADRLEATALAMLRARTEHERLEDRGRTSGNPAGRPAARRAARQREALEIGMAPEANGLATTRSWMPSIAGVGPVVLRWGACEAEPVVEEWRTYEAIRAAMSLSEIRGGVLLDRWLREVPRHALSETSKAVAAALEILTPATEQDLDAFARAVADRLAPQPRRLPATSRQLGALPRDWHAARQRRKERRAIRRMRFTPAPAGEAVSFAAGAFRPLGTGIWSHEAARPSNRATLGTLAAHYLPTPYNRHDARRWMRRFRQCVLVASDALEGRGDAGRAQAIEALCEVIGLEDAIGLTERPGSMGAGTLFGSGTVDDPYALADEMRAYRSPSDDYNVPAYAQVSLGALPMGARRRLVAAGQLPNTTAVAGMAPGQPARFEFTDPSQAIELERRADGWHVVGMGRGGQVIRREPAGPADLPERIAAEQLRQVFERGEYAIVVREDESTETVRAVEMGGRVLLTGEIEIDLGDFVWLRLGRDARGGVVVEVTHHEGCVGVRLDFAAERHGARWRTSPPAHLRRPFTSERSRTEPERPMRVSMSTEPYQPTPRERITSAMTRAMLGDPAPLVPDLPPPR